MNLPVPEVMPLPSWLYPWPLLCPVVLPPRPVPGRASFALSPRVLLSVYSPGMLDPLPAAAT